MTMHAPQLAEQVIRPVLYQQKLYSRAAEALLLGTAAQETHLGHYLHQVRGPAKGIYQMEPATICDLWSWLGDRPERRDVVVATLARWPDSATQMVTNLAYATAMARLYYLRVSAPLPHADDIEGLANYWKLYWNTPRGKGTPEQFIRNYHRFVLAPS